MTLPPLLILRDSEKRPDVTFGKLSVHGVYFCETLEEPWRENQRGVSCIPAGAYAYRVSYSPRFRRELIELLDVPGRSHIRIHAGNTVRDTEGCPLVGSIRGTANGKPAVLRSRECELALMDLMQPALAGNRSAQGRCEVRWA